MAENLSFWCPLRGNLKEGARGLRKGFLLNAIFIEIHLK
jgi:hypothetical protein